MKVILSNWAWIQKASLTPTQRKRILDDLTLYPKKVGDFPGDDPEPIELFVETPTAVGVAREYFLNNRSQSHDLDIRVTDGIKQCDFDLEFAGTLREEQSAALHEILSRFRNNTYGGVLRASAGWGKSSCFHTMVTLVESGNRVPLGSLVGEEPLVPSLLSDGSIGSAVASKVWECGRKECYRLTLVSGQWLEASLDHPVLTQHGWKRLDDLQPGREVLVAAARTALEPITPIKMSDGEVISAGLYIADGCDLYRGRAKYCKGSEGLVALFEDSVQQVPGFSGFGEKKFEKGAWLAPPHGVTPWIRKHGLDHRSSEKRIPGHLFGLPNRQLALLIRAIWTDGNLYSGRPRKLEIALGSEGLIDDLQEALRRFSVVARKSYTPKRPGKGKPYVPAWRLQIADKESLLLFAERVGAPFGMEEGFRKLLADLQDAETNTNWDVVPVGRAELREIRKECKHLSAVAWQKLSSGGGLWTGRSRFQALVEATGYTGRYAKYASMDVVWEGVRSIEPLGMNAVYDLTVPGTENVIANGLVVHNTVWTCAMIAQLRVPTLIVVHKEFLADQWEERIKQFLPNARVGRVQGDVMDFTGKHIVIGMVHTLAAHKLPKEFTDWPGFVVTDELHRIGAPTWSPVPAKFPARLRLGLSVSADSWVELRGGVFGGGWVGRVEDAFNLVREEAYIEGDYLLIDLCGVDARGWTGSGFDWKPVLRLIRHASPSMLRQIRTQQSLVVTDDHSVFRVESDGFVRSFGKPKPVAGLVECKSTCIDVGDVLPRDDGGSWDHGSHAEVPVDVSTVVRVVGVKVAVSLEGLLREDVQVSSREWWRYRNTGIYGSYVPLQTYLDVRGKLPEPTYLYTPGSRGIRIIPSIYLSSWAYMLGFWLGNGWVTGGRVGFAVPSRKVRGVVDYLEKLPGVTWHPRIRFMPGDSVDVRCSSILVSAILRSVFGEVRAWTKTIPGEWVVSWSRDARRRLLQGLIDSDGNLHRSGRNRERYYYTTTSEALARSLLVLLRSLGVTGGLHTRKAASGGSINGRQIEGRRVSYQVHWSAFALRGDSEGHRGLRTRFEHGSNHFSEGVVRSVKKVESPSDFVYDLEMEGHPSFVADGVLVHNTATPRRKDGADNVFWYQIGPILYNCTEQRMKPQVRRVYTDFRVIKTVRFNPALAPRTLLVRFLVASLPRNRAIAEQLMLAVKAGRKILVLSERLKHLDLIMQETIKCCTENDMPAPTFGKYVGGRKKVQLAEAAKAQVILATFQYACVDVSAEVVDPITGRFYVVRDRLTGPTMPSVVGGTGFFSVQTPVSGGLVGRKECVEIETVDGLQLTVSSDHLMWTDRGWCEAGKLVPGKKNSYEVPCDYLASPRTLYLESADVGLTEGQGWLLGAMIGDGSMNQIKKGVAEFISDDPELVDAMGYELRQVGMLLRFSRHQHWRVVSVLGKSGRGVKTWLRRQAERFGLICTARDKCLARELMYAPLDVVGGLLAGLYDTDGTLTKRGEVVFSSSSLVLLEQVRTLLLRLGVPVIHPLVVASDGCSVLRLARGDSHKFLQLVSSRLPRKNQIIEGDRMEIGSTNCVPWRFARELREALKAAGIYLKDARSWCQEAGVSSGGLIGGFRGLPLESYRLVSSRIGFTGSLDQNVVWRRVVGVKSVGAKLVGDFSVPPTKSWLYRGVVVHNSEGMDVPSLDTLFLTTPMSDVEQAVGRILRPCKGKKNPIVVDFHDDHVRMFKKTADYREATYVKLYR